MPQHEPVSETIDQYTARILAREWDMSGIHAERGVESLRDIAMYFAGHDINHFRQIESIRRQHNL